MTTDIFISRRACRFYLNTTRNYSSFKQTFPLYFFFFGRKISKLKILLVFHRKDVAKNKHKNKGWWGWRQEEKQLLFFEEESPNFGDKQLFYLYVTCTRREWFDISKLGKKPKKIGCFRIIFLRMVEDKVWCQKKTLKLPSIRTICLLAWQKSDFK